MNKDFRVITANIVENILFNSLASVCEVVKNTYIEHDKANTVNPESFFLRFPDQESSRIIGLPAALISAPKIAGIKWIGSNPRNIEYGIERASAVIILNDYETKYPIACIEGSIISKVRTACSAVVAAEALSKSKDVPTNIGIIGCGPISGCLLEIMKARNWNVREVILFDVNLNRAKSFSEDYCNDYKFITVNSYAELIKNSDLIIFGTSSIKPYINEPNLFSHHPLVLHISLRDLGTEIIKNSDNFVDDVNHVLNANTSVDLLFQETKRKDFIKGTLADVINNKVSVNHNNTRVFSPMGLGVLDLALARLVFDSAISTKSDIIIENFLK